MPQTPDSLRQLTDELAKLPGIGHKSAQRLALYFLKLPKEEVLDLARALAGVKEKMKNCTSCWNFAEENPCSICSNPKRNRSVICVVEEPNDVLTIERTNEYRGLYHVLGGSLSPMEGVGPDELKIRELLDRVGSQSSVREIILAMDPNVEGEATTLYLARLLHPLVGRVTRIARGIPIGSDLEFADQATLARALEGRTSV